MPPNEIELWTERLLLSPLRQQDDAALFAATSDPEVMRYWDWPEHDSIALTTALVAAELQEVVAGEALYWAIRTGSGSPAIGTCDLSAIDQHHRRAEVGFMLARASWGKGYAFEAMHAVIAHATDVLGIERLTARTHAGNDRSALLLQRLGFTLEGTLRGHVVRANTRRDCWLFGRVVINASK
jgi:ribosomal-protein-alanine N-acetyltransferase